jgi:hypothetical protein
VEVLEESRSIGKERKLGVEVLKESGSTGKERSIEICSIGREQKPWKGAEVESGSNERE